MAYMAYAYVKRKEVRSGEHETREDAARELLAQYPNLKSVSTSIVHQGNITGRDIRSHQRPSKWL
jgi:hypothetical protein